MFTEADTPYFGVEDHPYAQARFLADQMVRKFTEANPDLTIRDYYRFAYVCDWQQPVNLMQQLGVIPRYVSK